MKTQPNFVCDSCDKPLVPSNSLYDKDKNPLCAVCYRQEVEDDKEEN